MAELYMGYSLVDITETNITNLKDSLADPKGRNQQRNWETLVQVLSLRAQPTILNGPVVKEVDLRECNFGKTYTGKHRVWSFMFGVEQAGVYDNGLPFGVLLSDFNSTPIIPHLDETIKLEDAMFVIAGINKNIYFTNFKT